jgi:hypothetical protein
MLVRKNQEMAMQISLLNQENKQILDELARRSKQEDENEEKETIIRGEHIKPRRSGSGISGDDLAHRSKAV